MTPDRILSFALFSLAGAITPGPNNAMLLASGANFGVRRTVPHMTGVALGYAFLVLCVGLGLGAVFTALPILQDILWALGTLYLLWLAWKIANASGVGDAAARAKPFTFLQAVAFQWINPKAWTGAIPTVATYVPQDGYFANLALIVVLAILTVVPAVPFGRPEGCGCAGCWRGRSACAPSTSPWRCCWSSP
jgi:threonine/homoserine/homoserine lactone efflux protein